MIINLVKLVMFMFDTCIKCAVFNLLRHELSALHFNNVTAPLITQLTPPIYIWYPHNFHLVTKSTP